MGSNPKNRTIPKRSGFTSVLCKKCGEPTNYKTGLCKDCSQLKRKKYPIDCFDPRQDLKWR